MLSSLSSVFLSSFQGLPRYRFFPADTYGVVFQLGGIFFAVPGTSFFGGTAAVRNMAVPISAVPGTAKYCFPVQKGNNWHDRKEKLISYTESNINPRVHFKIESLSHQYTLGGDFLRFPVFHILAVPILAVPGNAKIWR